MPKPLSVLIVDDSEDDALLLVRTLERDGYEVTYERVETLATMNAALDRQLWNIVIGDYSMPQFSGTAALNTVKERDLDIPFIFVSGAIGEETAVSAMKSGAQDYVMKGNLTRLLPTVERELREAERRREHRRLEQQLRQMERFETIGQLAGGIAHDFNNVLGAIMGWAELGQTEVAPDSRPQQRFQQIHEQARRAADLTRQLLAFARRQILERRNINLNQAIAEASNLLQKLIGEQIEVKMVLAPDLEVTRSDPTQIEQVLMNLCINARDAMPKGGQLLIETQNAEFNEEDCRSHICARSGRYVLLAVSDTGIGMDAAIVEHIFEPFFTTKETGWGTGLGLATVYGIIKQHDGFIDVSTEPGRGTTFRVYLPVTSGALEERENLTEKPSRGGNETILIAEDHEGLRNMAIEILSALGYRVVSATDGEEAVQLFLEKRKQIDLILMDVVMPKLSGPGAYAQISELGARVPVIFTTGYSSETALLTSAAAKGTGFLQKPYAASALAHKVREALDRNR